MWALPRPEVTEMSKRIGIEAVLPQNPPLNGIFVGCLVQVCSRALDRRELR